MEARARLTYWTAKNVLYIRVYFVSISVTDSEMIINCLPPNMNDEGEEFGSNKRRGRFVHIFVILIFDHFVRIKFRVRNVLYPQ